jgi:hypothetical protein
MDVKSVFLNDDLKKEVYVYQPPGFAISSKDMKSPHEVAIYRWGNGGNTLLLGVYADDLMITDTKDMEVAAFKEEMKATF